MSGKDKQNCLFCQPKNQIRGSLSEKSGSQYFSIREIFSIVLHDMYAMKLMIGGMWS